MTKVVKYGRYAIQNMEIALESFRNDHIGLNAASRA
jgi:hypothetical protein